MTLELNDFEIKEFKYYLYKEEFIDFIKIEIQNFPDEDVGFFVELYNMRERKRILNFKKNKERNIKYVFITIQDFQRRMCDIDKLLLFIKRIEYLYEHGYWIIESGKADPPNIHLHLLVKIINPRKHKGCLIINWGKLFNNNIGDSDYYKLTQHRDCKGMPPYEQWKDEKIDYFNNKLKGDHKNSVELNLSGVFGGSG